MSATGTPTLDGAGEAPLMAIGRARMLLVHMRCAGPSSYDTGGSALTLPTSDVRGYKLLSVQVNSERVASGRAYFWDGSQTAPKLLAYTTPSGATEVTNATDISADTLDITLLYKG